MCAPKLYNDLPLDVRIVVSQFFKSKLTTLLFKMYCTDLSPSIDISFSGFIHMYILCKAQSSVYCNEEFALYKCLNVVIRTKCL